MAVIKVKAPAKINLTLEVLKLAKLRDEIKFKLENIDSKRCITTSLRTSMKNDYYKGGLCFEDIIKRSSEFICDSLAKSQALTEKNLTEENCKTSTKTKLVRGNDKGNTEYARFCS